MTHEVLWYIAYFRCSIGTGKPDNAVYGNNSSTKDLLTVVGIQGVPASRWFRPIASSVWGIFVGKSVTSGGRDCINDTLIRRDRSGSGVNEWGEHKGCELPRHFGKMHTIGPMQRTDHGNKPFSDL